MAVALLSVLPVSSAVGVAFLVGVIIAVAIYIGRIGLPESPRYLLSKGKIGEADKIVRSAEERAERKGIKLEAVKPIELDFSKGSEAGGYRRLFTIYRKG